MSSLAEVTSLQDKMNEPAQLRSIRVGPLLRSPGAPSPIAVIPTAPTCRTAPAAQPGRLDASTAPAHSWQLPALGWFVSHA